MSSERQTGTVRRLAAGYGFVQQDGEPRADVFFHFTAMRNGRPREGDRVTFLRQESDKGPRAVEVERVEV